MPNPEQGISRPRAEEQPTDKQRAQTVHRTHSSKAVSREATRDPELDNAGTRSGADGDDGAKR
jgi:hypothetical protein